MRRLRQQEEIGKRIKDIEFEYIAIQRCECRRVWRRLDKLDVLLEEYRAMLQSAQRLGVDGEQVSQLD